MVIMIVAVLILKAKVLIEAIHLQILKLGKKVNYMKNLKKVKAETELATKEMQLSKLLRERAQLEPKGSEAEKKDEAAAMAAAVSGLHRNTLSSAVPERSGKLRGTVRRLLRPVAGA